MAPALLAALLWSAPAAIELPKGMIRQFHLPAVAGPARLVVRARLAYWRGAGSDHALRIVFDGTELGPMRDRRTSRLLGPMPAGLPRWARGLWRLPFAPATTDADEIALDVSDLARRDGANVLVLAHAGTSDAAVVVEAVRLEAAPGAAARPLSPPPDWRTPRLFPPSPPAFSADGDPAHVHLDWSGRGIDVTTTATGGPHTWRREILPHATHVEVRDTIANPGTETVGLRIRHAVATDADWVHVAGRADPSVSDAYAPWNPTVFTPLGGDGVGLVAEDDVFREQLHADFDAPTTSVGLRTDLFCLGPGASYTLVWSIYPTRSADYWDFLNAVRDDWGVNRTVPGSYVWWKPDDVLAPPVERLRAALARQGVAVAAMNGGWVDPQRPERPPLIGFGTFVLSDAFAALRDRIRAAVERLHAARPGIRVLVYFDAQRDSSPDAPARFADSLLVTPGGAPETTDWDGRFSRTWSMVPSETNSFGRALSAVPQAMRALGADGLYWDEMDAVDYIGPRLTTSPADGHTCRLDAAGRVERPVGLVNLLGAGVKRALAGDLAILGNSPPTERAFQTRDLHMVEAHHGVGSGAPAQLSDPLGYLGSPREWDAVLRLLDEPLLIAGTRLDYDWDISPRLFPLTPVYIQPGTLRGRERIVTTTSGTHGWPEGGGRLAAFRYDAAGHEHPAAWHWKPRRGGVFVRVRLAPGEAAVIERLP